MLLKECSLHTYIEKMKQGQIVVDMVQVRCYREDNARDIVFFEGEGMEELYKEEDYYINLEESIFHITEGWLNYFFQSIHKNRMKLYIPIEMDGAASDTIRLETKVIIPKNLWDKPTAFLEKAFSDLSKFNKNILNVEFCGNDYALHYVNFHLQFSTRDIMKNIRKLQTNEAITTQWMTIYDEIFLRRHDDYRLYYNIPVVNGKMNHEMRRKKFCGKFVQGKLIQGVY